MSGENGKNRPDGGDRVLEQVQRDAEATLKVVAAAGEIAWAMWRLLVAERGRYEAGSVEPGSRYEGELPEPAARDVRQRIEAVRSRHVYALYVYVMACFSGALAVTEDLDAAALVLLDLATLHIRLDQLEVALRLIQVADAQKVSESMHERLARCREMIVGDDVQERRGDEDEGDGVAGGGR